MRRPQTDLSKKPKESAQFQRFEIVPQPDLGVGPFLANPVDGQPQGLGHHLVAQTAEMMHLHDLRSHAILGREPRQRVVERQ